MKLNRIQLSILNRLQLRGRGHYLWTDISELHYNWKNFQILFGTNKERIALLNETAPTFFSSLQRILQQDIILSIGRLTDPASSGKDKNNASFRKQIQLIKNNILRNEFEELENKLGLLAKKSSKIRDLRNKLIAHSDFDTKLGKRTEPLPGISRAEFEDILDSIRAIFNTFELKFGMSKTQFEYLLGFDDAEFLIDTINTSKKYWEDQFNKRKAK